MKVDPRRFVGKQFTLRHTWPEGGEDYAAVIDGLAAGRIYWSNQNNNAEKWFWAVNGPHMPMGLMPSSGWALSKEAAKDEIRKAFDRWLVWALKQEAEAHWHG